MHNLLHLFIALVLILPFAGCKGDPSAGVEDQNILVAGKEITAETFLALSTELRSAMKRGGVEEAAQYCNLAAIPITDSLASVYGVTIRRATDRPRNQSNTATSQELAIIEKYKAQLTSGDQLLPQVVKANGAKTFFSPIIASDLCLQCHGSKTSMESYRAIADLYPNDLATGYKAGDLRGVWSVTFSNYKNTEK